MQEKYTTIIGLEVHAQLRTKSKMFAPEATIYGAMPNTYTSAVTLAHPGTLPSLNKEAINQAIKMGIACRSTIAQKIQFARKNYAYPDLPKGYQITQDTMPICSAGYIAIPTEAGLKNIHLTRIHLEEDTGKSLHGLVPNETLLDFNRAGIPLIEIVTQPDLRTAKEAYQFLTILRRLVRYLDICDGNMEEGSLRCDANISVMPKDSSIFGTKVEVKNMNSIRHVQWAIEYETKRQIAALENGKTIIATTRAYDAANATTVHMRDKETLQDYRYLPEPDLSSVVLTEDWLTKIHSTMPILPDVLVAKFSKIYQLSSYDIQILIDDRDIALFFEQVCQLTTHYKAAANWMIGPVKSYLNEQELSINAFPLSPAALTDIITLVTEGSLSFSIAVQQLFPALLQKSTCSPRELAQKMQIVKESNEQVLSQMIESVLASFPEKVADYKAGKKKLLGMFIGEVMKKSQRKADPKITNALLKKYLAE